ncbi:MAG: pentapeptide repeat-containing protein [bacterium]|nr:pentapeptide repeat-containing protein [bacterium]
MLSKEDLSEMLVNNVEEFNNAMDGTEIDLSELDFSNNTIESAKFDNVDLTSSTFADSKLVEVSFTNCDLTSVDFNRATLVECTFNDSVLNGTDFSFATADYCNFADADLAGAIFRDADLSSSDLSGAENLNACRFDDTTIWPDNENMPDDFDSTYTDDLSSLKDEEENGFENY